MTYTLYVYLTDHFVQYVSYILQVANETIIFQRTEPRVYNVKVNKSFADEIQYGESYLCIFFCREHTKKAWSQTPKDAVEIKAFVNLTYYKTDSIVIEKVPEGSGSAGQTLSALSKCN